MKMETQVCTFEQAKKLKELGITQTALFSHLFENDGTCIATGQTKSIQLDLMASLQKGAIYYCSAFTVAELCAMLLCDAAEKSGYNTKWSKGKFQILYQGEAVKEFTNQAEALAYLLILLIEKGFTMPEMCNDRLLNA